VASAAPSAVAAASSSPVAAALLPTTDPAVHVFLWGNPSTTTRDLQLARDGGFHWVKQRFEWRNIEGKDKGSFEWNEPDRIVDAISQTGLKIIARVDNQPKWASSTVQWPGTGPPDKPSDWTDYLTALATRYKGRIQTYEIWNEPNLDREWGDQKPDPVAYTSMLKASYQAIKAADPQAIVVSAGMSPTATNDDHAMPDLDYIRAMYAAGARDSFDVLGVHAAGFKADPCADPGQVAQSPELTNNDSSPTDLKRIYAFRHVEDVHALMIQQGDANKQLAILEMGWTTDARPTSQYAWFAVDRDKQAANLVGAFQCARDNWQPWMGFMTVIYLPDPAWTQQQEQYWWSITNPDGTPRPAYTALKAFFATTP
jgi:polysaccharide biosynthesis protein PslG